MDGRWPAGGTAGCRASGRTPPLAETRGWAASKRVNTESVEKLKANGMNIMQPSAQLKADMKKVGETMLKEWLDKAGPEGKAMVDAYRK